MRSGALLAATLACAIPAAGSAANIAVGARRLVIVDRVASAGKGKVVYLSKDETAGITKGAGTHVPSYSARFDVAYDGAHGAFDMPPNWPGNPPWVIRVPDHVAKFIRGDGAHPPSQVKTALVRNGSLLKLAARGVGDEPIDIVAAGAPSGSVFTSFCLANAGEINCHCSEFSACTYKPIAGGTGAKLVCKDGVGDAGCTSAPSSFSRCCGDPGLCGITSYPTFDTYFFFGLQTCPNIGAVGSVCGAAGGCALPPVPTGGCCEQGASCRAGGSLDQASCETGPPPGIWFPSAFCGLDGTCE